MFENAPKECPEFAWSKFAVNGMVARTDYPHKNTHYEQPRALWLNVFDDDMRQHTIENLGGALSGAKKEI